MDHDALFDILDICICEKMCIGFCGTVDLDGSDWASGNTDKCRKHGVSIAETESVFLGEPLVGPDILRSVAEQKFRAVGGAAEGRSLFVVFTWRKRGAERLIRPVSARTMHRKEVEAHEKEIPGIQDGRRG